MGIGRTLTATIAIAAIALVSGDADRAPGATTNARGTLMIDVAAGEHWLRGAAKEPAGEVAPDTGVDQGGEVRVGGEGPQVAVWLQDPAGNFVATIFVTRRAAVEDWAGVPGTAEGESVTPRPLPVWAGKHRGIGIMPMAACGACHGKRRSEDKTTAGNPILEELTGPSSTAGLTREWQVPDPVEPGVYGIRVEINHWMDPNERYAATIPSGEPDYSGGPRGSGQPSVVWAGIVEIGSEPSEGGLTLIGHGHPAGADDEVDPDLSGLTTALSIADTIHVAYSPAE